MLNLLRLLKIERANTSEVIRRPVGNLDGHADLEGRNGLKRGSMCFDTSTVPGKHMLAIDDRFSQLNDHDWGISTDIFTPVVQNMLAILYPAVRPKGLCGNPEHPLRIEAVIR